LWEAQEEEIRKNTYAGRKRGNTTCSHVAMLPPKGALNCRMSRPLKYLVALLLAIILFYAVFTFLDSLALPYEVWLRVKNNKHEKWLLIFLPYIAGQLETRFTVNVPPLMKPFQEKARYQQYLILTGVLRDEPVNLHFDNRLPFDKFFILVLGWKLEATIPSLELEKISSYFDTEPDYYRFFFNPTYTGFREKDDYEPFATINLE
jgi:hypothetical protein